VSTGHDGPDGLDPLMAVLTGEPLPKGADAAEYRAAQADVALLRAQLTALGDTLGTPPPRAAPAVSPAAPVRRPRRRLLPVAAVGAAGAVLTLMGWLVVRAGDGSGDAAGSTADRAAVPGAKPDLGGGRFGDPAYVACARLLVEGDVTDVRPVPDTALERVTLRVTRAYRPQRAAATVAVTVEREIAPAPRPGDHVLVGVERGASSADVWITGEPAIALERPALTEALAAARGAACE
jgi:hypothetical protein